jgi:hypothetical protein
LDSPQNDQSGSQKEPCFMIQSHAAREMKTITVFQHVFPAKWLHTNPNRDPRP